MKDRPRPSATFSDQLRAAIDGCGLTRYQICKSASISEATMSRFMAGKGGLSMTSLDRLTDVIGLEVVAKRPDGEAKDGGA